MNQKKIGLLIIVLGIILTSVLLVIKIQEDSLINKIIAERNSCYLDDGTCLHENRNYTLYIVGGIIAAALIFFGTYMMLDKTQKILAEHQVKVASALEEAKKQDRIKDEFGAFLSGFSEDEQKVIKAIKEQEGIQQSTLRYRTGMSKTGLSLMLKSLQERGIISRKESGKTNEVYLVKKF